MTLRWPIRLGLYCILWCWSCLSIAAPDFPALSGRVVDNAAMLSPAARQQLSASLAALEQETNHQFVVVTLPNLGGYEISDYGYQLGRHWGVGQKPHDNGLLLIVAQQERRIRIEVGYGLEGLVTDAIASNIILQVMRPKFKQGQYEAGIIEASELLMSILKKEPIPASLREAKESQGSIFEFFNIMMFGVLFLGSLARGFIKSNPARVGVVIGVGVIAYIVTQYLLVSFAFALMMFFALFSTGGGGSIGGGGFGGAGRSSGGFSGGGGSFGGGGASGGW